MTRYDDLDDFAKGYFAAMIWSTTDESDESGGEPMDANYDQDDLSEQALERIAEECKAFQEAAADLLEQAYDRPDYHGMDGSSPQAMAGHDFWLTRNHHGAGFWDREALKQDDLGNKLTEVADSFGECYPGIGDDGLIYID